MCFKSRVLVTIPNVHVFQYHVYRRTSFNNALHCIIKRNEKRHFFCWHTGLLDKISNVTRLHKIRRRLAIISLYLYLIAIMDIYRVPLETKMSKLLLYWKFYVTLGWD